MNGKAPYAIILRDVDSILCTGAIVAEEFFGEELDGSSSSATTLNEENEYNDVHGADDDDDDIDACADKICTRKRKIPIIVAVGETNFARLRGHNSLSIYEEVEGDNTVVCIISSGDVNIRAPNLLKLKNALSWEGVEHPKNDQIIDSPAESLAKRTISRIASVSSSSGGGNPEKTSIIPITSAHIDAVTYIGRGGLLFVQKLVELGGRVKVP